MPLVEPLNRAPREIGERAIAIAELSRLSVSMTGYLDQPPDTQRGEATRRAAATVWASSPLQISTSPTSVQRDPSGHAPPRVMVAATASA